MDEKKLLKSKKLRITDFRLTVLRIFLEHDRALSVNEIEEGLEDFDRITLYRTLKSFQEKGLIHEIALPNHDRMLALCDDACTSIEHDHNHVHFRCSSCDGVYCLDVHEFPEIKLKGFQIDTMEIQLSGVCKKCS